MYIECTIVYYVIHMLLTNEYILMTCEIILDFICFFQEPMVLDVVVDRRIPDTRPSSWRKSSTPTTT